MSCEKRKPGKRKKNKQNQSLLINPVNLCDSITDNPIIVSNNSTYSKENKNKNKNKKDLKNININNNLKYDDIDTLKFQDIYQTILKYDNIIIKAMKEKKQYMKQLMQAYKHDIKYIAKHGNKRKRDKDSGVTMPIKVPDDIADYIEVPRDTMLSRPKIHSKLYHKLKDKKLQYDKDKRVLRADDELKKIFDLPDNVNEITDAKDKNGLTIYTLQTHIAKKFAKNK